MKKEKHIELKATELLGMLFFLLALITLDYETIKPILINIGLIILGIYLMIK